jgi:hypothetical protein
VKHQPGETGSLAHFGVPLLAMLYIVCWLDKKLTGHNALHDSIWLGDFPSFNVMLYLALCYQTWFGKKSIIMVMFDSREGQKVFSISGRPNRGH